MGPTTTTDPPTVFIVGGALLWHSFSGNRPSTLLSRPLLLGNSLRDTCPWAFYYDGHLNAPPFEVAKRGRKQDGSFPSSLTHRGSLGLCGTGRGGSTPSLPKSHHRRRLCLPCTAPPPQQQRWWQQQPPPLPLQPGCICSCVPSERALQAHLHPVSHVPVRRAERQVPATTRALEAIQGERRQVTPSLTGDLVCASLVPGKEGLAKKKIETV